MIRPSRLSLYFLIAVICYSWGVLVLQHGDMLYAIQDFSPWQGTEDYFKQFIGHPGGLREWIGDWLTQLFYYPWLGATVMAVCWSISMFALIKSNRLEGWWRVAALIPIVSLLAGITDLGYWIFCLKANSYWFGPTLGLLCISLLQYGFSRGGEKTQLVIFPLMILIGYPILGWYATLGAGTLLFFLCKRSSAYLMKVTVSICISLVVIVAIYTQSSEIHWRDSLVFYGFHHIIIPEASSFLLEVPFWVLAISFMLLPIIARLQHFKKLVWLPILLFGIALAGGNMLNYRNVNFHTELRMLRAMDEARWDDVLSEIKIAKRPTREMVIMKDVALAQMGQLGEKAFDYPVGGIRPQMNIDLPIHMAHSAAPLFYYWLGIPNYAFMWCFENNIEYGLSPFYLRIMYRSMLANGELEAAEKYKRLLGTTLFYHDYEITADETKSVQRFMTGHDELTNDRGYSEIYLLNRLSKESYDTPVAQQIAVHFAILSRNQDNFVAALNRYQQLLQEQDSTHVQLPKYFNQKTFDWYYDQNTGNKSY